MKIKAWISGLGVLAIGLTTFTFNQVEEKALNNAEQSLTSSLVIQEADLKSEATPYFRDMIFSFWVQGHYTHPANLGRLQNIHSLDELISAYPGHLLHQHQTIALSLSSTGEKLENSTETDRLSMEQLQLLKSAHLADEIFINVKFISKNAVTNVIEDGEMDFVVTVVPDKEAEFPGGNEELLKYLRNNCNIRLTRKEPFPMKDMLIEFNVNNKGNIEHVRFIQDSGIPEANKTIERVLGTMPKWRAAEDQNGKKIFQKFQLRVSEMDGC